MVRKISQKVTDRLLSRNVINDSDYEIYQYGLELLLTSILNLLTLIAIGMIMGMMWQAIIFVFTFIMLRKYAGGYHSSTPLRCYILTCLVILNSLSVMKYIKINIFVYLGLFVFSSIIILTCSPVESANKKLDKLEKTLYRKKTVVIWLITSILAISALISQYHEVSLCIFMADIMLSVSLLLGKGDFLTNMCSKQHT